MCLCVRSVAQSCLTFCAPVDCSPPGSSIRGIAQERILEWIAISSSRRSSQSRDRTHVSCIGRQILYHCATLEDCGERDRVLNLHLPLEKWMCAKLLQSCPILDGPMDGSPPGSAIPGILQATTLEWVAISFPNA